MSSFSRVPYVSKCCCFIRLRVGAYLNGFLQLIFGLGIIVCAFVYPSTDKDTDGQHSLNTENSHDTNDRTIDLCITGVAFILLGGLLVLGVKMKNFLLIRVYISLEMIVLLAALIIYILVLINVFMALFIASSDTSAFIRVLFEIFAITSGTLVIVAIVIVFAVIALKAYFLVCVNSYLKELIKLESGTPLAVGYTAVAETDDNIKI